MLNSAKVEISIRQLVSALSQSKRKYEKRRVNLIKAFENQLYDFHGIKICKGSWPLSRRNERRNENPLRLETLEEGNAMIRCCFH